MKTLPLILILLTISAANAQDINNHYKIYDTRSRQLTSLDKIISDAASADVLFFGEEHNDSAAHFLEKTIYQKLFEKLLIFKKTLPIFTGLKPLNY